MRVLPDKKLAEIVCLGNELLMGVTVNTNSAYIGKILTIFGYEVRRISCIRDDLNQAVEFFHEMFQRKPNLAIITGGLGPTYDDIQLEIIANATGLARTENDIALEQIRIYYERKGLEITKERRKMALMPLGGKVLKNNVGGAPACKLDHKGTTLFCLPGVPTEMQDIFENHIISYLQEISTTKLIETKFKVYNQFESNLASIIGEVKKTYSEVYVKSHPSYGEKNYILFHIAANGEEMENSIIQVKELLISKIRDKYSDTIIEEEREERVEKN